MFARVRCHYCGAKTPHSKTIREFSCKQCEATNFLDGRGNIVDTPLRVAAQNPEHARSFLSHTRDNNSEALSHQKTDAFCRTCVQNQHLHNETLANYLPDESHPQYAEFERAIPQYKKELEKRYPLVCKACAPLAQAKINRADTHGMTENASKLIKKTNARMGRSGVGQRDDAGKKTARFILNTIGLVLWCGLLYQLAFHVYGILTTAFEEHILTALDDDTRPDFDITTYMRPSLHQCAQQTTSLLFTTPCFHLAGQYIPHALALATFGLLYNPGYKAWYDHTYRIEAVHGQWNYFYMQLAILFVRYMAWWSLSDPTTAQTLDTQQILAMHIFTIFFTLVTHSVATNSIKPIRWTMRGRIMPKPSEMDVLGASAAPAKEHYTPKASKEDPFKYLRKQEHTPLNIRNLAPQGNQSGWGKSYQQPGPKNTFLVQQQPSPETSDNDYDDDDCDPMELDDAAYVQHRFKEPRPNLQPTHTYFNHTNAPPLGVSSLYSTLPDTQPSVGRYNQQPTAPSCNQRTFYQYQVPAGQAPSPFYGSLPQAPMSLERRLRNPPAVAALRNKGQEVPMSQRKDFMAVMREGISQNPLRMGQDRGAGGMELRKSEWVLPGDVRETGLEERFGSVFSLDEERAPQGNGGGKGLFKGLFGL